MKQALILLAVTFCCFTSCKKTSDNGVYIRIQNNTSHTFKEVITNEKSFMNVDTAQATPYQFFNKAVNLPFVTIITENKDTAYAGMHYIDPPIYYLTSGKYTLEIFEDTSAYYGYNCSYIKN
jgi:hypothetical protein